MFAVHRLRRLVIEIGQHGLLFGRGTINVHPGQQAGTVEEVTPAVRAWIDDPVLPDDVTGTYSPAQLAVMLVAGASRTREDVEAVERAAAQIARHHGVTLRELAAAGGITERTAQSRYALPYVGVMTYTADNTDRPLCYQCGDPDATKIVDARDAYRYGARNCAQCGRALVSDAQWHQARQQLDRESAEEK